MTGSAVRRARVLVPLVALQVLLGAVVLDRADETPTLPGSASPLRARPAPDLRDSTLAEREAGVRALLAARAAAVRTRDREAFLATVDPQADPGFRARQAALFDALAGVPLADWEYDLDPARERPRDPDLDRRHGPDWWAPQVTLRYRLADYDDRQTAEEQWLTLVPREGRWLVAADDDFASTGGRTQRGLWDAGPVISVARSSVLVLGHPGDEGLLRQVARTVQAAVPRVSGVWGQDWAQRVVVLVPRDADELRELVGGAGDLSQIAAVAVAEVDGVPGSLPVGDRIVVNPSTFQRLGATGRRVVLTHEVAHVATRAATGPRVPVWLVEGLADHLGYLGTDVPLRVAARDLRAAVRAGEVPDALPDEADFDGGSPDLAQAYEQAWLAVALLVERYGAEQVVELYRAVGRAGSEQEVEQAYLDHLGMSAQTLTVVWRDWLVDRLR